MGFKKWATAFCVCGKPPSQQAKITLALIGLDNAGKTTLLANIRGEPPSATVPTWGFISKNWECRGCQVTIYDLGGSKNIRRIWDRYFAEVHGFVCVIDAADADRFHEAKEALSAALKQPQLAAKPILFLANKQDLPKRRAVTEISAQLDESLLPKGRHRFLACTATAKEGGSNDPAVAEGMEWLVGCIKEHYKELNARVEVEAAAQMALELKAKAERRARAEASRAERLRQEAGQVSPEEEPVPACPPMQLATQSDNVACPPATPKPKAAIATSIVLPSDLTRTTLPAPSGRFSTPPGTSSMSNAPPLVRAALSFSHVTSSILVKGSGMTPPNSSSTGASPLGRSREPSEVLAGSRQGSETKGHKAMPSQAAEGDPAINGDAVSRLTQERRVDLSSVIGDAEVLSPSARDDSLDQGASSVRMGVGGPVVGALPGAVDSPTTKSDSADASPHTTPGRLSTKLSMRAGRLPPLILPGAELHNETRPSHLARARSMVQTL